MKIFEKAIQNTHCLIFMDLEATATSHELIELGAYRVLIDEARKPIRISAPFKCYVKAKNPIGRIVTNMTGITEEKLKKEGLPFEAAMNRFHQFVGGYWKGARFVTFGSHDMVILHSSLAMHGDAMDPELVYRIIDSHFDFQAFLSQYVQDRNGCPYSLHNYLNIFEVPFEGQEHDALADAFNLYHLYKASLERKDILTKQYELTLSHFKKIPTPLKEAFRRLSEGEDLTVERWKKCVEDTFR